MKVTAKLVEELSRELIRKTGCSLTEAHEALGNARCNIRKAFAAIIATQRRK